MATTETTRATRFLHVGLTGGIGSGKSTVAARLAALGAVVIDADRISRDLMAPGSPVLEQVVGAFGPEILAADGSLDRQALAARVFAEDAARERLNGIVHPAVREEAARQLAAAPHRPDFAGVVVEDIPLLTETGQAHRFDGVVVVRTEEQERVRRLTESRGMDAADAHARIAAQATDAQRQAIATWTVDNSGTPERTQEQVDALWERWQEELAP